MKLSTDKTAGLKPLLLPLPLLLFLLLPLFTKAQSGADIFPPKPEPAVYVHDYAGWLSAEQRNALEIKLRRYWDSTSTQIVVMIRPDIGDYDKSSYAFELGNRWGIGKKSKDNGVLMLIKSEPPDRGIFIATGYGTEGALPDITAGQIIRNTMGPYFRQQQYYEGIDAGTNEIIRALSGEFKDDEQQTASGGAWILILFAFLIIFCIVGFVILRAAKKGTMYSNTGSKSRQTRSGGWLGSAPWIIGGGGWGGGGSSGGGGWGGGDGGGFGDGGSFGGGSFGGGGAGGDW